VSLRADVGADAALTLGMVETLYSHPARVYHNLEHVRSCLEIFDGVRLLAEDRDAVEFALWVHDCVFDPERPDNESRSADAAGMIAGLLGCHPDFVERVRALVLVTRHERTPAGGDDGLASDVDLAVLGAEPGAYGRYRRAIREEFAFASDEHFAQGRHAFLERMLGREWIYSTAWFRAEYEARARENMGRELVELEEGGAGGER
jgi:predicted metal-dependent HD superfamily phosphohydrolase